MKRSHRLLLRLGLNALAVFSVLFLPWWCTALCFLALLSLAHAYEIVVWGAVYDVLYGPGTPFLPWGTLAALLLLVLAPYVKRRLLLYE